MAYNREQWEGGREGEGEWREGGRERERERRGGRVVFFCTYMESQLAIHRLRRCRSCTYVLRVNSHKYVLRVNSHKYISLRFALLCFVHPRHFLRNGLCFPYDFGGVIILPMQGSTKLNYSIRLKWY
jgi:hypothetical protein